MTRDPFCMALAVVALGSSASARAQSVQCGGYLIGKGDRPTTLLHRCGEPIQRQMVCPSLLQLGWVKKPITRETEIVARSQCVRMDEWLYDSGPGSFLGIVRIHNGVVESVRDGPRPR